jgi:hypothetical protein
MSTESIGFLWGFVTDNRDPNGLGRVRFSVPGMFEPFHPEWALPLGWPGAGGLKSGSKYPVEINAQIAIFFEKGDISAPAGYFPALYGALQGVPAGPPMVSEVYRGAAPSAVAGATGAPKAFSQAAQDVLDTTVIWEDESFRFFITSQDNDKRFVMVDKKTGSGIELNAADGAQGNSVSLTLAGNTSVTIESKGVVDIRGAIVQIQGRRVMTKPGVTSI